MIFYLIQMLCLLFISSFQILFLNSHPFINIPLPFLYINLYSFFHFLYYFPNMLNINLLLQDVHLLFSSCPYLILHYNVLPIFLNLFYIFPKMTRKKFLYHNLNKHDLIYILQQLLLRDYILNHSSKETKI